MTPTTVLSDDVQTQELLAELRRLQGARCAECATALCGHATLMSLVVGCQDWPRCLDCLARQMGQSREDVRDHLLGYIRIRPCRLAGWQWANREEQLPDDALPSCMWSTGAAPATLPVRRLVAKEASNKMQDTEATPQADDEWDAGALGCGELVMGLRQRLMAMQPRGILKLTATDAGMPEDLPAWCRLTGHTLVLSKHPEYWIQRREN